MYIVFEGAQGSGKTLQSKRLASYLRKKYPRKKVVWTREPGSTEISEAIRTLVQGTEFNEKMNAVTDCYLYAAARAQSLRSIVKLALDKGHIVVSDRSFITSMAIQGEAQGFGITNVWETNKKAVGDIFPDIVVYVDLDIDTALARTYDASGDKWEKKNKDFLLKMSQGYSKISKRAMFKSKWLNVDGSGTKNEVFDQMIASLKPYLKKIKS